MSGDILNNKDKDEASFRDVNSNALQPLTVDYLKLTKPIKDYEEFNSWLANKNDVPDYIFGIKNMRQLTQQHTAELLGDEFQVPNMDRDMSAQIKCNIKYEDCRISIRFLKPKMEGKEVKTEFNPVFFVLLKRKWKQLLFGYNAGPLYSVLLSFTHKFVYGEFYPIFNLNYQHCIKYVLGSKKDSIILPLFIKNSFLHDLPADDGHLLWKVDVSHLKLKEGACFGNEKQIAFSPFICSKGRSLKAQLRLFVKGKNVEVEARTLNINAHPRRFAKINLMVINPHCPIKRINKKFEIDVYAGKTTKIVTLAGINQIVKCISDKKLLLTVEIKFYDWSPINPCSEANTVTLSN